MSAIRRGRRFLFAVSLVAWGSSAAAAPTAEDRVLAQSLAEEGRELMNAGEIPAACTKLAQSHRLDATLGTLLDLAQCHEKEGKVASACAEFKDAAAMARTMKDVDREESATRHAEALEGRLPQLVLLVPEAARGSLEITLDAAPIPRDAWGNKVPVDPGAHRIEARAPNKQTWSRDVVVAVTPGQTSVEVPVLADVPDERREARPIAPPAGAGNAAPESTSSLPTIGWITGGVGVAALGVGAFFGARTLSLKSDRDAHCAAGNVCDQEGVALDSDARSAATISTIGIVSGAVLVAAGVALVLVGNGKSAQTRTSVGANGAIIGARW
jgi:hypothetical protein